METFMPFYALWLICIFMLSVCLYFYLSYGIQSQIVSMFFKIYDLNCFINYSMQNGNCQKDFEFRRMKVVYIFLDYGKFELKCYIEMKYTYCVRCANILFV